MFSAAMEKTMNRLLVPALISLVLVFASPAFASKRVALVIGNSAYESVEALRNPATDAQAVAGILKRIGFNSVTLALDVAKSAMDRALADFAELSEGAEIAVLYYSGHGIEVEGKNYLIPVDASLKRARYVAFEATSLSSVMDAMEGAKKLRLVILDACRSNPFRGRMMSTGSKRSVGSGLAVVAPGSNTLVAYAAREGTTADDGVGKHSPFTAALLSHIEAPGVEVRRLFGKVRDDVLAATGNRQEPFTYGSMGGEALFLKSGASKADTPKPLSRIAMLRQELEALRARLQKRKAQDAGAAPAEEPTADAPAKLLNDIDVNELTGKAWSGDATAAFRLAQHYQIEGTLKGLVVEFLIKAYLGGTGPQRKRALSDLRSWPEIHERLHAELIRMGAYKGKASDPLTEKSVESLDRMIVMDESKKLCQTLTEDEARLNQDPGQALKACRIAVEMQPDDAFDSLRYGLALRAQGKFDLAYVRIEKAASKNVPEAMLAFGRVHYLGHGTGIDKARARDWYSRAMKSDPAQSKPFLVKFASKDDIEAMYVLGMAEKGSTFVTVDNNSILAGMRTTFGNTGKAWFRKAAALGNLDARWRMLQPLVRGSGCLELFEAAHAGSVEARQEIQWQTNLVLEPPPPNFGTPGPFLWHKQNYDCVVPLYGKTVLRKVIRYYSRVDNDYHNHYERLGRSSAQFYPTVCRQYQQLLKASGYYNGAIDGDCGSGTQNAFRRYVGGE